MMGYPIWKLLLAAFGAFFVLLAFLYAPYALAEELHDHASMGDRGKFYSEWRRPKGNFSGIEHRKPSCCNRTDCDFVMAVDIRAGELFVKLEREPNRWYRVDPSIIESNQEDPRESPDGRSHGRVIGGVMACFVEGGGI